MAQAYSPHTSHNSDWRLWPGRENAKLRQQRAVGAWDTHPLKATGGAVMRQLISWKELAASAGAYTNRDRAWLIPAANLPSNVLPKPGDQVRDLAEVDWTIGDVEVQVWGQVYKCVARALAVENELSASGQLKRATYAADTQGRPAGASYANVGDAVLCRVQPVDSPAAEFHGRVSIQKRYTGFLATPLTVRAHDQFVATLAGASTTYTITAFRNAERIWDLMEIDLELRS